MQGTHKEDKQKTPQLCMRAVALIDLQMTVTSVAAYWALACVLFIKNELTIGRA
jgi:hypothetical protein